MTPRLPALKPKDVLRALQKAGFFVQHATGSHRYLKHPDKPQLRVTVPYHNRDLKRGTLHSIIKQSGIPLDEFLSLL
jgi:predicted RNA binding protein YcfA (HicA-like mRNA interferase family)